MLNVNRRTLLYGAAAMAAVAGLGAHGALAASLAPEPKRFTGEVGYGFAALSDLLEGRKDWSDMIAVEMRHEDRVENLVNLQWDPLWTPAQNKTFYERMVAVQYLEDHQMIVNVADDRGWPADGHWQTVAVVL